MPTRRQFLASLPAAALAVTPAVTSAAASASSVTAGQDAGRASATTLPPSIAALTSLRGQATPITVDERRARIERARALMAREKLDAIVLAGGTSLSYFTGARWGNSERLMALVLPQRGDAFGVMPAFEAERVREQLASGPLSNVSLRLWQEDESPFASLAAGLKERGMATGRVGVEETLKFVFSDGIAVAAPTVTIVSATPVVAGCRMIKSSHELALMRLACRATLTCYEAIYKALRPGMTDTEVGGLVAAAYARLGFRGEASVQVGEYTASPHGSATPQTIREGTIIMMDDGCVVEGYLSDITRTFVLGKPTDKMRQVFAIVSRAQAAALKAARPGVSLGAIDAAARQVISDAGYGPGFKYFTHRLGHGIGMDMHEWPYLVPQNMYGWERDLKAQVGMTFSDEPGIYIPGEFGIRLEDDMVVTEGGAELLTPPSRSLDDPFAH